MARGRKKKPRIEEQLSALQAVRDDPDSEASRAALREALESRSGPLVASAARLVGELSLTELVPSLSKAFCALLEGGLDVDPGCRGKEAIAEVLAEQSAHATEVFLQGIRCVQLEPVWGGREDTAAGLRAWCGLGLAHMGYLDASVELARLLTDKERAARLGAATALGCTGREDAIPLLRFKVLSGDPDPEVVGECLKALLLLSPKRSLEFVTERLEDADDDVVTAAALALGEARVAEALPSLIEAYERRVLSELRERLLLAIALLRSDAAFAHLLGLVADGDRAAAKGAVRALAVFRHDEGLRARVEEAASKRKDKDVRAEVAAAFGGP